MSEAWGFVISEVPATELASLVRKMSMAQFSAVFFIPGAAYDNYLRWRKNITILFHSISVV